MRLRIAQLGVLTLPLFGSIAAAQSSQPTAPAAADQRLDQVERRLNEMESKHQADLKSRDEEIARLRQELTNVREQQKSSPTSAPAADAIEQTKNDVLKDIADNHPAAPTIRMPASFNPDVAVISDFLGSWSSNRSNDALNRIDVREVELDLRAALDPRADGVAVLAFARDAENPVFPTPAEQPEGPESSVEVEEAYLFLHDFGVPNLTAKLGRFHVRFGRQNMLHLHDLPTSDPSLVNQAFLAPESLTDGGISLSYVVPPNLVGGQYVEVIGEALAGEGAGSESPTLRGDLSVDSPGFNTHVLWNTDLTEQWNLELGGSWLTGHADSDNSHDVNLYGGDVTLIHTDSSGRFFNQLFQAEVIYADSYDEDGVKRNGWGAYLLGQQQLNRDWFTGVRLDYTQDPNSDHREAWAVSPYLSWYWSEFLRFRLEYQHKSGDVPTENNVYLQATWIFGAHPPHPYWSMR